MFASDLRAAPNEKAGAAVATNPPDVDDEGPPNLKRSADGCCI